MRKTYLNNLPRWEEGRHKGRIDWSKSVGFQIYFNYDNVSGEIKILEYNRADRTLTIAYLDNIYSQVKIESIANCNLGEIIGLTTKEHRYPIGYLFDDERKGKLKIIGRTRHGKLRGYEYKCLECGNKNKITEYNIRNGVGCSVCSGKVVKVGFNDIHTTTPWMGELLANHEDGHKYTNNSNKKIPFKCLKCNNKIIKQIDYIFRNGLSCKICSDGVSYPNKFMHSLLKQLNINFQPEYYNKWAVVKNHSIEKLNGVKRYDFYAPRLNLIIEMHGIQHYKFIHRGRETSRTLEEEIENDHIKNKLAKENGIEHYIVIDARYSDMEYIKNKILISELSNLFDFTKIDWLKCHEFACSSRVKEACNIWNGLCKDKRSVKVVSEVMKLSKSTVMEYLKRGEKIGWCDYNARDEMTKPKKGIRKPVVQLSLGNKMIAEFTSAKEAEKNTGIYGTDIIKACKGKRKTVKGFKWMYKEDYISSK